MQCKKVNKMTDFQDAYQYFRDNGSYQTVGQALRVYLQAFQGKDADTIISLMDRNALAEVPLLRPSRLFGESEIRRGHVGAFANMDEVSFRESHPIAENEGSAMCFGALKIRRVDRSVHIHDVGIVAQDGAGGLRRISLYFDSRNIRRWADKTIV